MPFPYRLAAVDLDDTLLGPDKLISRANFDAVQRLREAGCHVTLASGRRHENMLRFHGQLDLRGPIVSCNGALVKDAETGMVSRQVLLPAQLAQAVVGEGVRHNVTQNYYHTDGGLYVREETGWTALYEGRTGSRVNVQHDLSAFEGEFALKIIWIDAPDHIADLQTQMRARYGEQMYITTTDPEYLEFMALGVSKAAGVATVAETFGIRQSEVLAFGDGNNDVPLLEWAGLSIAMSHGRPSAHQAADRIAPPGDPETDFARAVAELLGEFVTVGSHTGQNPYL